MGAKPVKTPNTLEGSMTVVLGLALAALILAAVSVVQSQGRSLCSWAVVLLAVIHLLPLLV